MKGEHYLYKLTPGGMSVEPRSGGGGAFVIKPSDVMAAISMARLTTMEQYLIESIIYPIIADEGIRELLQEQGLFGLYREFLACVSQTDVSNGFYIHAAKLRYAQGWKIRKGEELLRKLCDIVVLETVFPGFVVCQPCGGTGETEHKKCSSCDGMQSVDDGGGKIRLIGSGRRYLNNQNYARLLDIDRKVFARSWKDKKATLALEMDAITQKAASKIHWAIVNEGLPKPKASQLTGPEGHMYAAPEAVIVEQRKTKKPNWAALNRPTLSRVGGVR